MEAFSLCNFRRHLEEKRRRDLWLESHDYQTHGQFLTYLKNEKIAVAYVLQK
jgi:hypothetical protein